ncbi:methionine--tRNA ligase [Roseibacillus ishigakijimensis]|uniref:Methionine--tRNA ligase n=1 Tax=Roseibacillus ishigakijimensis TaxID=454146 RepID=A0A934RJY5_9BACT|nr:methionine--tRNA ligase [Roseibacillus ishigakijimensis]MBK1832814.1 methionine--tRNA ligase [Roseibacillus ishigakijimensis]
MIFLTTAIDYPNGSPHIGHAYEKVLTDVLARYHRLCGEEVYFLTGVDQHGQKMVQTAEKEGVNVATLAKKNTKKFLKLLDALAISNDGWAETTDERHKACVAKILTDLHEKGQLYKKSYAGFYSVRQEQFLTDKERGEDGEFGPEWGEVVELEEENWYFKLSEHTAWLREAVESDALKVTPAFRKSEVLNAIEKAESTDLCISRPKERLSWGIPLPFDPEFVTYVWFDALINYISFAGYQKEAESGLPDFDKLWPAHSHVIGKDIMVPAHAIYWPCMLHAMGFSNAEMPGLLVHGWWNVKKKDAATGEESSEKMSKSLGNIVDPMELVEKVGTDAVRYYLARDIATGKDSDFDPERLFILFNSEMANGLGNLLNRSLNMTKASLGSELAAYEHDDEECQLVRRSHAALLAAYPEKMAARDLRGTLESIVSFITDVNTFAERTKPWELKKDESKRDQLTAVLHHMCEACALASVLLQPFVPAAAEKMQAQLNAPQLADLTLSELKWGLLRAGQTINKPKPVFPRLQKEEA